MEEGYGINRFIEKFSLEGKKAIVTGGAKGLCNGMAQALHDAGGGGSFGYSGYCGGFCEGNGKGRSMVYAVKGDLSTRTRWNLFIISV